MALSTQFPEKARQLRWLILIAALLLVVGLFAPVITLKKFIVINNTFSVFSGVIELFLERKYFLFLVITGFSIVLPVLKLGALYRLVSRKQRSEAKHQRYLHWMHEYGKWSMLDVFVVAILVVSVKLGAIADVQMRYGLYAFAGSVLLTMIITAQTVGLTNKLEAVAEDDE